MAGHDRKQEISGKTIAAARAGDQAAYDELLSFVAAFSYAAVRRTGLAVCECEEISQEVSLRFRRSWDPAKTNDSPCALKAFIGKLADRSLVDYFRKLAGYRALLRQLEMARRVAEKEPDPLLEQGESRGQIPPAAKGGGEDLGAQEGSTQGKPAVQKRATLALECILRLKKQDGSAEVLYERMDREQAHCWLAKHLLPTITDYLCGLSAEKRAVAIGVWLADTAANATGDVSDEQLRQILARHAKRLDRFLYNWQELGLHSAYTAPSGKEIAARFGLSESKVSRLKDEIEADVKQSLQRRVATRPGSGRQSA